MTSDRIIIFLSPCFINIAICGHTSTQDSLSYLTHMKKEQDMPSRISCSSFQTAFYSAGQSLYLIF